MRMSHILTKTYHRHIIVFLLVLFCLFSFLPSYSITSPPTRRPIYDPAHHEQGDDQIMFEGDILSSETTFTWPQRAQKVKTAFMHAYAGYKTYAFGMDELRSVSNGGVNK